MHLLKLNGNGKPILTRFIPGQHSQTRYTLSHMRNRWSESHLQGSNWCLILGPKDPPS
jgi:hypothetical protein